MKLLRNFGLILAISLITSQALGDQVRTQNGAQTGTVINMTKDTVTLSKGGSNVDIPVNEIVDISFEGEPFEAKQARQMISTGQLEDAIEKIKGTQMDGLNKNVQTELMFMHASATTKLALAGGANKQTAANALLSFASKNPNNWHFYEAAQMLGDLAISAGNYSEATKYYTSIANAPWPDYQMRARVLTGRALLAQNKPEEALSEFDKVTKIQASTPNANRQKDLAKIGKASALAKTGKVDQGLTLVEEVLEKGNPKDSELFGNAYNTMGACYVAKNMPKDALLAYLHVDILFYSDPELHAEALYNLSNLWKQTNNPDNAVAARELLRSRYSGSIWASKP